MIPFKGLLFLSLVNYSYSDDGDDGKLETILNCNNINTDGRSRNDNEMYHDTMKGG